MANYWDDNGRNKPHNPNAPRPIPQTPPELVAAIRAMGQKPTESQIQAALDYMDQQDPAGLGHTSPLGAFGDRTFDMGQAADNDIRQTQLSRTGDSAWMNNSPEPRQSGFLQALGDSMGGSGVGKGLGGLLSGIGGIAKSIANAANQAEGQDSFDPMDLLSQLRAQYGQFKYTGPSAESMVSREFDPQFAALSGIERNTQNRYKENSGKMQGLYGAMADSVLQGRGQDAQVYKQAGNDINASYAQGSQNVTNNMNSATKEMGAQLALLGQNEAAPTIMQDKQQLLAQQLGDLSKAQGTAAALNTQLGANTYAADTAQHGIAQQAGLNAQADLNGQLEQLMQQYGAQRMGLEGARGQALNNYGMNIQKLVQEGTSGQNSAINDAFETAMRSHDTELDRELKRAGLDLDAQRLAMQSSQQAGGQQQRLNPYDALLQRSSQANDNPQEAANDAETLYQTYMGDVNAPNIKALMDMLEENSPGWLAQPGNKALAYDYFTQVLAGNKR